MGILGLYYMGGTKKKRKRWRYFIDHETGKLDSFTQCECIEQFQGKMGPYLRNDIDLQQLPPAPSMSQKFDMLMHEL